MKVINYLGAIIILSIASAGCDKFSSNKKVSTDSKDSIVKEGPAVLDTTPKKDTCYYSILIPADLDKPKTPYFDTTIVRGNCKAQILLWPDCGTEANYVLFQGDSLTFNNKDAASTCHVLQGQQGKMDITGLPADNYKLWLQADCNGGVFSIKIK